MVRPEVSEEWGKVSESSEVPETREAACEVAQEVEPEVVWAAVQAAASIALMHSWVAWS
jgi:hypothetical protein